MAPATTIRRRITATLPATSPSGAEKTTTWATRPRKMSGSAASPIWPLEVRSVAVLILRDSPRAAPTAEAQLVEPAGAAGVRDQVGLQALGPARDPEQRHARVRAVGGLAQRAVDGDDLEV